MDKLTIYQLVFGISSQDLGGLQFVTGIPRDLLLVISTFASSMALAMSSQKVTPRVPFRFSVASNKSYELKNAKKLINI